MNNISIELSGEELSAVINGLYEREHRMFMDSEAYKKQGNKEAQMDCLREMDIARKLRERIQKLK